MENRKKFFLIFSMKRYAAVKVPGALAPWEPDAGNGGAGRAALLNSAAMPPSPNGCIQGRERKLDRSGRPWRLPRKEVIQPHLPVRLPCYDFTPLTLHTFDASAPERGSAGGFGCRRLGWCDGRCVQGPGTHSPRRADPRLLATPASRRRVAASDPNWGRLCGIRSPSRGGNPLCRPL